LFSQKLCFQGIDESAKIFSLPASFRPPLPFFHQKISFSGIERYSLSLVVFIYVAYASVEAIFAILGFSLSQLGPFPPQRTAQSTILILPSMITIIAFIAVAVLRWARRAAHQMPLFVSLA